jgi:hypothetical protein
LITTKDQKPTGGAIANDNTITFPPSPTLDERYLFGVIELPPDHPYPYTPPLLKNSSWLQKTISNASQ